MQRIQALDPAQATPEVAATLAAVKAKLGGLPNLIRTMARAPAVLNAYVGLSGAIAAGKLPRALREQIALATAGANACDYCASAHSALGRMAGLAPEEIKRNLAGEASDAKAQAAIAFARKIVAARGLVDAADIAAAKAAGYSEEEVLEIFGNVALNLFTNYFNHLVDTDIDFPRVDAKRAA